MNQRLSALADRTAGTLSRIDRLLRLNDRAAPLLQMRFEQPAAPVRSAAAEFAGRASGLPQLRDGETLAEFVGAIDPDERRE